MKKTLLSITLLASLTAVQAQREVGITHRFNVALPENRGTDTVVTASLGTGLSISGATPGGFVTGSNGYGDYAKVQEFQLGDAVSIDEVLFIFVTEETVGGAGSTIKAVVYDMTGTGTTSVGEDMPAPGTLLGESAPVSISDLDTLMLVGIPVSASTDGHFAAGIDVTGLAAGDHVGILATDSGAVVAEDRSWELWETGAWHTIAEAWGLSTDMAILPVVTADWVGVGEGNFVNGMRMTILGGNPARDNVTINFENEVNAAMSIKVIDAAGRTVVQQDLGNRAAGVHNHVLNTNEWNAGKYYVTLSANGKPMTMKLVVE